MKPRSMFINASRGMVVDDVSLRENILSGHIAGAALDVFPVEPKAQGDEFESALRGLPNVILTPHVGGSTQEAQEEIGYFVSGKLSAFAHGGSTALSVNLPEVAAPPLESGFRIALLHHNVPGRARLGQPGARRPARPTSPRSTSPPAASRATWSPTWRPRCPTSPSTGCGAPTRRSGCAPTAAEPAQRAVRRWAGVEVRRSSGDIAVAALLARTSGPRRRPAAAGASREQRRSAAVAGAPRRHDAGAQVGRHGVVDARHPGERARVRRAADARRRARRTGTAGGRRAPRRTAWPRRGSR